MAVVLAEKILDCPRLQQCKEPVVAVVLVLLMMVRLVDQDWLQRHQVQFLQTKYQKIYLPM
jgi:hypothetical protein